MTLFDIPYFLRSFPNLLMHLPITLIVAFVAFFISLLLGFVTALIKIYRVPVLKYFAGIYISFIRGTPLLVQLYLIAYGIPKILYYFQYQYGAFGNYNVALISPIVYAIVAFSINVGAYNAEMIRSSIEAVGAGQFEAAQSVGMTQVQLMRRIIIPQALNVAIPNLGNTIISSIKETSFIFVIGIIDLMGEAKIIGARGLAFLEVYVAAALIYWVVCFGLEKLFAHLEKRTKKYEKSIRGGTDA
ncbi:amino acid ABC transporter permease [Spirochaetia bacterium]|nr:amino acid ABC transporter permease [Spirochaetia bacterium]